MRGSWMSSVGVVLGLLACRGAADEVPWRAAAPSSAQAVTAGGEQRPALSLGRPVPVPSEPATAASAVRPFTLVSHVPASPTSLSPARPLVRAQIADPSPYDIPPPPPPPPPPDFFQPSQPAGQRHTAAYGGGPEYPIYDATRSWAGEVTGTIGGWFRPAEGRRLFQSDHAFDHMISPITNPFLFEDPRALTEIRPILILQDTPRSSPFFKGGNIDFFGIQGRLAVTDRLSIVLSKFGWIWIDPVAPAGEFAQSSGFAELHIGPKYTLIRNTNSCTLLALGLNFDIATGPARVFQDTGDLSLTPYVSFAQNFGKTSWGSFNFMNTTGYSFGTDSARTDYFYSSFHLDFDVGNFKKIYPLVEINWVHYTQNGRVRDLAFEGKDLINFGTKGIAGFNELSVAFGLRYKFTEMFQLGAAFEFPLLGQRDRRLDDFRFTFDAIFRF